MTDQVQHIAIIAICAAAFVIGLYGIVAGDDNDRNDPW
jgi:hypothetical protein